MEPRWILAFLSSRRSTARAVTDFPQPLSPTSASVLPGVSVRSTCRTASISGSSGEVKTMDISAMVRMGLAAMGISGITEAVSKKVHGQNDDDHADAGGQQPGGG